MVSTSQDCRTRRAAYGATGVVVLQDESAVLLCPLLDPGRVCCTVVVRKISPSNIITEDEQETWRGGGRRSTRYEKREQKHIPSSEPEIGASHQKLVCFLRFFPVQIVSCV